MSEKKAPRRRPRKQQFATEVLSRPGLKDIPVMPDLAGLPPALAEHKIKLSQDEFDLVRVGVAIYISARRPRLSPEGMMAIAMALAIGAEHAMRATGSTQKTDWPYRQAMTAFLRHTGLTFISESERVALGHLFANWEEVLAWFDAQPSARRNQLTDPEHLWNVFKGERAEPLALPGERRPRGKKSDDEHAKGNIEDAYFEMRRLLEQSEAETDMFRSLVATLRDRLMALGMSEEEIGAMLLAARDRHFGRPEPEVETD